MHAQQRACLCCSPFSLRSRHSHHSTIDSVERARLVAAQRKQEARAAALRRLQGNPAGGSIFATSIVSPLRLASCTRRSRPRLHVTEDHPLFTQTCLAAARHAPEGPHAVPSCDGCAAPLALSGSGEHGLDVLSTPSAQLQAESSDRAVVTRERRWLVAEWTGRTARTARASQRRAGAAAGARHGRLRASQAPYRVALT